VLETPKRGRPKEKLWLRTQGEVRIFVGRRFYQRFGQRPKGIGGNRRGITVVVALGWKRYMPFMEGKRLVRGKRNANKKLVERDGGKRPGITKGLKFWCIQKSRGRVTREKGW